MPREGHHDFNDDEEDNDELEHFCAVGRGLIGDYRIGALNHLQCSTNALLPLVEMEALRQQAVNPRDVLVPHKFEHVCRAGFRGL